MDPTSGVAGRHTWSCAASEAPLRAFCPACSVSAGVGGWVSGGGTTAAVAAAVAAATAAAAATTTTTTAATTATTTAPGAAYQRRTSNLPQQQQEQQPQQQHLEQLIRDVRHIFHNNKSSNNNSSTCSSLSETYVKSSRSFCVGPDTTSPTSASGPSSVPGGKELFEVVVELLGVTGGKVTRDYLQESYSRLLLKESHSKLLR